MNMQQIELTKEIKDSTERILNAGDVADASKDQRLSYLLDMLQQAMGRSVDSAALAFHHLRQGYQEGLIPASSAIPLAELYMQRIRLDLENMRLAQQRKDCDDVKALMGICTAQYTK